MSRILLYLLSFIVLTGCQVSKKNTQTVQSNLFYNGDIVTMASAKPEYVEALVEENGKIVFVGQLNDAEKKFPKTAKVDLKGKTLLPGFIDPHSHFGMVSNTMGQVDLNPPPVGNVSSIEELIESIKKFKEEQNIQDGKWIFG